MSVVRKRRIAPKNRLAAFRLKIPAPIARWIRAERSSAGGTSWPAKLACTEGAAMLSRLLAGIGAARRIERLATDIAIRTRQAVHERLAAHVTTMTPAEIAGYVRARAAAVVQPAVALALVEEQRVPAWGAAELHRQTTDTIVLLVTRDVTHKRWKQAARKAA